MIKVTVEGAEYEIKINIQPWLDGKATYQATCEYNDRVLETGFRSSQSVATNAVKALIRKTFLEDKKRELELEKLARWNAGLPRNR